MAVRRKPGMDPTGKIGHVVNYERNGELCQRILPDKSKHKDAKSPKQMAQRQRLSVTVLFTQYIADLIRLTYASQRKGRGTAGNAISSHILREGLTGEYPNITIDCEKIMISRGELEAPKWATVKIVEDGYLFEWDTALKDKERLDDLMLAVKYSRSTGITEGDVLDVKRKDGKFLSDEIQTSGDPDCDWWIGFCNKERTMCCDSVYVRWESAGEAARHQALLLNERQEKALTHKQTEVENETSVDDATDELQGQLKPMPIVSMDELFDPDVILQEIIALRKQQGINQTKFGEMIGKSRSQISKIESGTQKLTLTMFYKILKALNVEMRYNLSTVMDV
ncbi:XRE family transcriptional regulator [Puteibacter caeruleilacunae]|nr:XRE family transcriptional regulator [Puteibacter caeruleilacunae]